MPGYKLLLKTRFLIFMSDTAPALAYAKRNIKRC